ncbi:MAG TPA: molybdenum ABC transporter ATP-binding protein [Steroidobacteraceae bacterium]|jgi:molybdate transport system ATP-binding protein|nr:molybdenum ABC transporter ATP-binding protein [Steroidobacteraceae bacterium]
MRTLYVSLNKHRPGFALQVEFAAPIPGVIALFGRSGSGKTTLVNMISGLLAPDTGEVRLDDEVLTDTRRGIAVPPEQRRIGYVFQDARLFPHLTVAGNLRYGAQRARGAVTIGFDEVVALLGLEALLARRPRRLSGGERQRVSLGRALLSQPRLLLLDEPLASLDVARREEVLPYLESLRDRLAIPMVYVSHQFEEVLRLATHLVLLDGGRVPAHGTVSEMSLRPELQSIIGPDLVGAVIEGVVTRFDPALGSAELAVGRGTLQVSLSGVTPGARVRLQLLARDVILATQPVQGLSVRNALASTVIAIDDDERGAVLVRCDVGGSMVLARITHAARQALNLRPGDAVWTLVKAISTRGHTFTVAPAR